MFVVLCLAALGFLVGGPIGAVVVVVLAFAIVM
jgi:hypothetical protein